MGSDAETMVARVVNTLAKSRVRLGCHLRGLIEARRRRAEREREFYRDLKAYYRANSLSPVCDDDWKTGG